MSRDADELINGYLDETLTSDQHAQLVAWLTAGSEHACRFADAVMLHDRMRTEFTANETGGIPVKFTHRARLSTRQMPRVAALAIAASVVVAATLMVWRSLGGSPADAAMVELDRIVDAAQQRGDRTYFISEVHREMPVARAGVMWPPIDGALLYVRGPSSYVLVRGTSEESQFVTGYDGRHSWSVPPRGMVRVSTDSQRFRGAVPGQQHAIPFIDLRENLDLLRDAYDLRVIAPDQLTSPDGTVGRLEATRKENIRRGPKRVVIWYDSQTNTILRMLFDRLPQAKDGPDSLVLELVDERNLGPTFFLHESHHDADRQVIHE